MKHSEHLTQGGGFSEKKPDAPKNRIGGKAPGGYIGRRLSRPGPSTSQERSARPVLAAPAARKLMPPNIGKTPRGLKGLGIRGG